MKRFRVPYTTSEPGNKGGSVTVWADTAGEALDNVRVIHTEKKYSVTGGLRFAGPGVSRNVSDRLMSDKKLTKIERSRIVYGEPVEL